MLISTSTCYRYTSVLIFGKPQVDTVRSYALYSANDSPNRDPVAWTLSGGQTADGPWFLLSQVDDAAPPMSTDRQTIYPTHPLATDDPCVTATETRAAIASTTTSFVFSSNRPAATISARRPTVISTRRPFEGRRGA
jgi:hypothetical protein